MRTLEALRLLEALLAREERATMATAEHAPRQVAVKGFPMVTS
jgi:hypothetical protein